MTKTRILFIVAALAAILVMGCQSQVELTQPNSPELGGPNLANATVAVDSAIFSIYVGQATGQTVNVHRITADWTELGVTYNNFAGAFDPTIIGTISTATTGWKTVNVTGLVQDWLDGAVPNFGIFLEQGATSPTVYASSQYTINTALHPMLTVCFSDLGGPQCITMQQGVNGTVADSYIWALVPNGNFGTDVVLFTGLINGSEKQTLLKFELPTLPELASIGDFVWYDTNANGIQDAGELGLEGITVHLMDCAGNILGTTTTSASGYYLFDNLLPGNYNIHFVLPAGYFFSPADQGSDDAVDSDADVTTGMTICTTLDPGENDMTWDAGLWEIISHGCTHTIGYWKTHAGFGPQPDVVTALLPQWLGTNGGTKSINVNTALIAYNILTQRVYGEPSNGITKLYAQLLGAKLSMADGADGSAIATVIANADAFLATHNHLDWSGLTKTQKNMVNGWKSTLDSYNNGLIGPEHCY